MEGSTSSSSSGGACASRGTGGSSKGGCASRATGASSKGGCDNRATGESVCGMKNGKGDCPWRVTGPGNHLSHFDFRSFGPSGRDGKSASAGLTFEPVDAAPLPDMSHGEAAAWRSPPDGLADQDVGCYRCHWTGHRLVDCTGCPVCFWDAPVTGEPKNTRRTAWWEICRVVDGHDQSERLCALEAVTLMSYCKIGFPETFTSVQIVNNWHTLTNWSGTESTRQGHNGRLNHREFLRIYIVA